MNEKLCVCKSRHLCKAGDKFFCGHERPHVREKGGCNRRCNTLFMLNGMTDNGCIDVEHEDALLGATNE
jgi:hypothetical protein